MIQVEGPDGAIHEFDDAASPEVIKGVMARHYGSPATPAHAPAQTRAPAQPTSALQAADDIVRALANGVTGGYADKFAAKMNELTGVSSGGVSNLVTGGDGGSVYERNLAAERAKSSAAMERAGGAGTAAQIIGSLLPASRIAKAYQAVRVLPQAPLAISMATGAGVGTLDAAGNDRNLAEGAAFGAGAGLLGHGVAKGAAGALGGVAGLLNRSPDVLGLSGAAKRHLRSAIEAEGGAQTVLDRLKTLGPNAMLLDAGPALTGKAQGAAILSDDARSILSKAIKARNEGTNARLQSDINMALGPQESAIENMRIIKDARSNVHRPLRGIFNTSGEVDATPVARAISSKLETAEGPEKAALTKIAGWLKESEGAAAKPPVRRPVIGPNGQVIRYEIEPGTPSTPARFESNAENLHNMKVAIDNMIKYGDSTLGIAPGAISKEQGSLSSIRGMINNLLRENVEGYSGVMDKSSELAKMAGALEKGTTVLTNAIENHPSVVARELSAMTPGQKYALKLGVRSDIERRVGTTENDLSALKGIVKDSGDWNYRNMVSILGSNAADALSGSVSREKVFRDAVNKIVENSQTAQRQAAARQMKPSPLLEINATSVSNNVKNNAIEMLYNILSKFGPDHTTAYNDLAKALTMQAGAGAKNMASLSQIGYKPPPNAAQKLAKKVESPLARALTLLQLQRQFSPAN